ncbi:MAG: DUF3962 domain-containing protein [Oscillatoria sp. Prado101]|jgi:hypothetical protein|nr:DUF3962 domain-containing protein [Oscillatoria sp. Prado101]
MPVQYNHLRTLAFQFSPEAGDMFSDYFTLKFPDKWKEPLKSLQARLTNRDPKETNIPIGNLNKAFRALVPDIISIARYQDIFGGRTWIYSRQEIETEKLFPIVQAWVKTSFRRASESDRQYLLARMQANDLRWEKQQINITDWGTGSNGTAAPVKSDSFILFADEIAARLSEKYTDIECDDSILEYCSREQLSFRRAPLAPGNTGTELISWPPFCYKPGKKRWPYSLLLTLTVQTVPFQEFPGLYIDVGLRRWGGATINPPTDGKETSIYLLTSVPWIEGFPLSNSFQVAPIRRYGNGYGWGSKLADLLNELHLKHPFPSPADIFQNPEQALNINDRTSAALVYRTGLKPDCGVRAGVMPGDRSRLAEKIAEILKEEGLKFVEPFERVQYSFPKRQTPFADDSISLSERHRAVGEAVNLQLTLEIWHQSDLVRDALIKAVRDCLGLQEEPASFPHTWETPELSLTVRLETLAEIGAPLEINTDAEDATERLHKAIRDRCKQISQQLGKASHSIVAFIELQGAESFDERTDPKHAIRLGFAHTGRLTQFINPDPDIESLPERAKKAALDGLRQLGVWPLGEKLEYSKRNKKDPKFLESLPKPELNCVGLWMIKHYAASSPVRKKHFLPVMVYLEWYTGTIQVFAPGFKDWLPYPQALLAIAQGQAKGYGAQKDAIEFIKEAIDSNLPANTLLICHAQNLRLTWHWLTNTHIQCDQLTFGQNPANETPTPIEDWEGLRIVRVRDSSGHETPEYYAQDEDEVGFTKGLFRISDRVFASTAQKSAQQTGVSKNLSKFIRVGNGKGELLPPAPNKQASNPQMIEITVAGLQEGDEPAHWAALVHELRHVAINYSDATQLPLPLDLAAEMKEYTLPVEDEEE